MSVWTKAGITVAVVIAAAGAFGWFVTAPKKVEAEALAAAGPGNVKAGEQIFWAAGCSSCHAAPDSKGEAQLRLGGGVELKTAFGTFVTPNISPDPQHGIGKWSLADFADALTHGVDPHGRYLYPAFPYTSYTRMKLSDIADLFAFLKTLPPVAGDPPPSRVSFPFNIRRGIGLWDVALLHPEPVVKFPPGTDPAVLRGQYLVEGPGHCGECHTPRNAAGATDYSQWLAGAPNPTGKGVVPNITSGKGGIGSWSAKDIAYFLESGFTPDFDTVGGDMVDVQANIARLPASDRAAIAAYLKAVPPKPNGYVEEKK
ncbi:MAG TPA: cytochrome c [Pararhizobium sp.]|nr:cytochrome c [Pararhizobium sp.]